MLEPTPEIFDTESALHRVRDPSKALRRVDIPEAFPAFGLTQADERRIRDNLNGVTREWKRGLWSGPRNHALGNLRCGYVFPSGPRAGQRCGWKLHANYITREGTYRYTVIACTTAGHRAVAESLIDDVVEAMVLEVVTPDAVRRGIERLRRDSSAALTRRTALISQLNAVEARAQAASEIALDAHLHANRAEELQWRVKRQDLDATSARLRAELEVAASEESATRRAAEADVNAVLHLASDLPDLMLRARSVEGARRAILNELVDTVFVRWIAYRFYHVEVVFRSGATRERLFVGGGVVSSQPERATAFAALKRGDRPLDVARWLTESTDTLRKRGRWTAERVRAAALAHEHIEWVTPRGAGGESIAELARRTNTAERIVWRLVLRGVLGPAAIDSTLTLRVRPTEYELQNQLPEYARWWVAHQHGWSASDLLLIAEAVREFKLHWRGLLRTAIRFHAADRDVSIRRRWYLRRSVVGRALQSHQGDDPPES